MIARRLPQPFGFYELLTGSDHLHFGCWPEGRESLSLSEAQEHLTGHVHALLPAPPAKLLDVGCGLGATAGALSEAGYEVVAVAPSQELVDEAENRHPGPRYYPVGFLDEHLALLPPEHYDAILFQESLQYFSELPGVFERVKKLLSPGGRLVFCDEVSYDPGTREESAVHQASEIERVLGETGFYVRAHRRLGPQVERTCREVLRLFDEKRKDLIEAFGEDSRHLVDHYVRGWKKQLEWYETGRFGYELWDARPDDRYRLRTYRDGDENAILGMFRSVFGVPRSLEHWNWKFRDNPFGGPCVTMAWENHSLVSHYAAYPVPVWMDDHAATTCQVGDTMTHPAHRGAGRGPTSLLARAVRLFHRLYCEDKIPFFYGFNTGKIQKFGKMFLRYEPAVPVCEWILAGEALRAMEKKNRWLPRLSGYTVEEVREVDSWADELFDRVAGKYGWLVARNARYLKWRYLDHPDYSYTLMLVRRFGKPVGFWIGRMEGDAFLVGDALFDPDVPAAPEIGLSHRLKRLRKSGGGIREVKGWFSGKPDWWGELLNRMGFTARRQWQDLDLCVTTFSGDISPRDFAEKMYFTWGDSDLF